MEKCVYCGKRLTQDSIKAKAHTRSFDVCDSDCKAGMEEYINKDKKYKTWMFLMIFIGGIGFLLSALFGKNANSMLGAYLGQILGGAAFLFLPYPILSFETFHSVPIKRVVLISRITGGILVLWGIILVGSSLR